MKTNNNYVKTLTINELLNLADEISKYDFSTLPSGIIHGDIFPDNVLLDEYNNIKLFPIMVNKLENKSRIV